MSAESLTVLVQHMLIALLILVRFQQNALPGKLVKLITVEDVAMYVRTLINSLIVSGSVAILKVECAIDSDLNTKIIKAMQRACRDV